MANDNYDPWQVAEEATVRPSIYFGQIDFDIYPVVFQKGVRGGIPFDAQAHKEKDRRTLIKMSITPLASANVDFDCIERDFADFADEWVNITLHSIKTLIPENGALRKLKNKWVKYEMVKYGTYIKQDTGEEKNLTTYKILDFYETEEAAEAAASALYGGGNGDSEPAPVSTGDPEKDAALQFLPSLVASVNGDREKVEMMIANTPLIKKHFEIDSPEVVALLTPEPGKVLEEEEIPF